MKTITFSASCAPQDKSNGSTSGIPGPNPKRKGHICMN